MDNKLLLAVNFLGVDKLSGSIHNIVASGKQGASVLKSMKAEVRGLERELVDVRKALSTGNGSWSQLSLRQRELERAIAGANARFDQQKRKIEQIAAIRSRATAIADKTGAMGQRATVFITAPLVAFGVQSARAAMDAEELQSAFDITFGKSAAAMNSWALVTANAMGRSVVEMKKGANTFGMYFNQVAAPDKAAAMSRQFAVLAQDLGSFFNTDTQTAIDKLRSGLSGESEPLRDFGVFLTEAAVKSKALSMGLKPIGGQLTEQQKIMARYALILDSTSKAQGDVARTSQSTTNRIRASQAAWANLQVVIGQRLIPALTPLLVQLSSALEWFGRLSPATQGWIVKIGLVAAAAGPLLIAISGMASGVSALAPALRLLGPAFTFVAAGVRVLTVAMMTNPLGLLIAAVALAAYLIWANWDRIRAAFVNNWTQIRNIMLGAVVIFTPFIAAIMFVGKKIYDNWGAIKSATMSMVNTVSGIVGPFIAPFIKITAYIEGLKVRFFSFGVDMIGGLVRGILSMEATVIKKVLGIAGRIGATFASAMGIKSPSRLFMGFGGYITEGLAMGLDKGKNAPLRTMARIAAGVGGAAAVGLASPSMATSPAAMAPRAAAGAATAATAITYNITIQIAGASAGDPKAAALAIKRELDALLAVDARGAYHDV